MLEIKVNKIGGDYCFTRINANLEETAKYYFSMHDIESIDILSGGTVEDEFCITQPLKMYREIPENIKKYDLFYDVRLTCKTTYKYEQPFGFEKITSFGFVRTM